MNDSREHQRRESLVEGGGEIRMVGQSVLSFDVFSLTSRSTFGIYSHVISLCSKSSPNFCLFCLPHKRQRR